MTKRTTKGIGIFIVTMGTFILWAWVFKEIFAGLAGM